MSSNIVFKSNVYPIEGSITSDKEFISKISDYNRLRFIYNKSKSTDGWSDHQRRILNETPFCSLNPKDPCWGMTLKNGEYRWICKCTKTDCSKFTSCRKGSPYSEKEQEDFAPIEHPKDDYGYKTFISKYDPYPISESGKQNGTYIEYNSSESIGGHSIQNIDGVQDIIKVLRNQEKAVQDSLKEETEKKEAVENKHPENKKVVIEEPKNDLIIPENIFEYFEETDQESIIKAEPNEALFVDAGPGTGKTYTLIQKLNYMVSECDVDPESIMVLCFTNAAVDVIKKRLKDFVDNGADRSLINVDVRTFHSFAWWLISQANELFCDDGWTPVELETQSYDMSLKTALNVMKKFGKEVVGNWEHFIVDEVQDLTNNLAEFVLKIVHDCLETGCGVTALGDSCQAIYDYTQDNVKNAFSSEDFYNLLFVLMNGKGRFLSLTENHRQNNTLIETTSGLRKAILTKKCVRMSRAVEDMLDKIEAVESGKSLFSSDTLEKYRDGGNISILLRNNGQTMKLSSDLRKRGINHTLNVTESKNNFAPWIADIFRNYSKKTISQEQFEDLYDDLENTEYCSDEVWERFQALLHTENDVINVRDLLDSISECKIDDPVLRVNREEDIVISNIHRAKGREYDCVVVDSNFADELKKKQDKPDEYKTLYVAVTRPKKHLYKAAINDKAKIRKIDIYDTKRSRWGKGKKNNISYLEFDSNIDLSVNRFVNIDPNIFDSLSVGDSIVLKRRINGGNVDYEIIHEDTETGLGYIEKPFIEDIKAFNHTEDLIEMPSIVSDIYISGIYSKVVDSEWLETHPEIAGVSPNGVWKWIELIGIGHLTYDVY